MFTQKLLAAVGIAGALILGASADASANRWRGSRGPVYRPAPVVVAPVYRAPIYRAPVVMPPPRVVVYQTPVYGPMHHPGSWRHRHWAAPHGHRW